ncbi:MAG: PrgI family protein [Candidatus Saccharimonadales bacterium]
MATYKVIQDIEAEDKFVGPFTLKQFVFAAIGVVFSYLCFFVTVRGLWFAAIPFAPFALFGFFMAIPWSKDQPTDLWVLAKIRFKIKPKKRIWDQAGKQDLVTITAPKKPEKILTKDLSETEVQSRLKILADTMNTRGWAVKHSDLPGAVSADAVSDRLIPAAIQSSPNANLVNEAPDMLESNSLDALIDKSEETRKAGLQDKMEQARHDVQVEQTQTVEPSDDIQSLSEELKEKKKSGRLSTSNMQKLQAKPRSAKAKAGGKEKPDIKPAQKTEEKENISKVTEPVSPDIISLAHNNDLNVATLARQANKDNGSQEVVISLH